MKAGALLNLRFIALRPPSSGGERMCASPTRPFPPPNPSQCDDVLSSASLLPVGWAIMCHSTPPPPPRISLFSLLLCNPTPLAPPVVLSLPPLLLLKNKSPLWQHNSPGLAQEGSMAPTWLIVSLRNHGLHSAEGQRREKAEQLGRIQTCGPRVYPRLIWSSNTLAAMSGNLQWRTSAQPKLIWMEMEWMRRGRWEQEETKDRQALRLQTESVKDGWLLS